MADINDWVAFIRGRWDWSKYGYEDAFPRGCQFTDVDATTEFDGRRLVIEPKHYDGVGPCPYPNLGQRALLRDEVSLGKTVIVLYGCGACNNPHAIRVLGQRRNEDRWEDWRELPIVDRRQRLKDEIDRAMGLGDESENV